MTLHSLHLPELIFVAFGYCWISLEGTAKTFSNLYCCLLCFGPSSVTIQDSFFDWNLFLRISSSSLFLYFKLMSFAYFSALELQLLDSIMNFNINCGLMVFLFRFALPNLYLYLDYLLCSLLHFCWNFHYFENN